MCRRKWRQPDQSGAEEMENDMNNSNFIRLSGWALILGGVAFSPFIVTSLLESTPMSLPFSLGGFFESMAILGFFWSPVLLAVGMLGLRACYGDEIGSSGRGILLLGALAGILVVTGNIINIDSDASWEVFVISVTILFLCLLIFGVQALIRKPLPRMNWLPLVAGLWFPMISLPGILGIHIPMLGATPNLIFSLFTTAGMLVTTIALIMLGYLLQADAPQEMATAP
jgi:hypothetical protein